MRALILAAGVGRRLCGGDTQYPPKALLRFVGKTLLQRHVEVLTSAGVDGLDIVVGYCKEAMIAASSIVSRSALS